MKIHDKEVVHEICKEFKTMQSVPFENICKVYGGCLVNNGEEVWLVMEFVDGGDLHNYLKNLEKPLPIDLLLSFFIQATKALASLHNAHFLGNMTAAHVCSCAIFLEFSYNIGMPQQLFGKKSSQIFQ